MNRLLTVLLSVVLVIALTACTQRMNWRQMPAAQGVVQVLFPAKPVTQSRKQMLGGMPHELTLSAAKVDQALFAVGWIDAAKLDAAQRQAALQALEQAMLQNIGAATTKRNTVTLGATKATEVIATGTIQGKPARLNARFFEHNQKLIEVIAVGPQSELTEQDAETFISSIKLTQ